MAVIRPFRGVRYNQSLGDLSAVICPPYDIITPVMQSRLYQRSQNNFVRLEFGQESPTDTPDDNRYTRSRSYLEKWLAQGVLEIDGKPALYVHDHHFAHKGKRYCRRSLIALVKLADWSEKVVRPHEGTLSRPKSDRLALLRTLRANTSPIMALYEDAGGQVSAALREHCQRPALHLSVDDEEHDLWAVAAPDFIKHVCESLAGQPLYIADGHHRYESALVYRNEMRSAGGPGDGSCDFVMMSLVDFADPGLVILPAHRLVRCQARATLDKMRSGLQAFFDIEELPASRPGLWPEIDAMLAGDDPAIVMFGPDSERLTLLRPRHPAIASRNMPGHHTELYRRLNVSIADHVILEHLLGLDCDGDAALDYTYARADAVNKVLSQEFQLALLLNPVRAATIKAIADADDRLPRKSTYFYPKSPAGLVFYRMM
ncbi:MAG: DUF1015 domain-containing protein [Chloroflexi bacterium]|nr:DUF1015 domain-containing protein [Chloroflexota bacterium]